MGWQIVRHSFVLLFRNLSDALRVSVGPILLAGIFCVLAFMILRLSLTEITLVLTTGVAPASVLLAVVLALAAFVFVSAWIAVAWHRFILLEEYPGLLPAIEGRPIWPYAGRSFVLGMLILLALVPAAIAGGILTQLFGESDGVLLILGFALGVYLTYFWMRLAVVLPGVAIGRPLKTSEAWAATATYSGPILTASAILVALNLGSSWLIGLMGQGIATSLLDVGVSWLTLMVGTSVLTSLYGVAVERRALPA